MGLAKSRVSHRRVASKNHSRSGESKVLVFFRVCSFNMHAPYICPPTIWVISLELSGKHSILEADDFLGACYSRTAKRGGGVQMGGVFPIWTCPSFFVLFCPFPFFSGFS